MKQVFSRNGSGLSMRRDADIQENEARWVKRLIKRALRRITKN